MNRIYYHLYTINDYYDRFDKTYQKITSSKLINVVDIIETVIVGEDALNAQIKLRDYPKVSIKFGANHGNEGDTLRKLWDDCQAFEGNILYLHSKGVTRSDNVNVQSWIDCMEYFCIENFEKCLDSLVNCDTIGVNLGHFPMTHYSGNFWWATSGYIRSRDRFDHGKSSSPMDERPYSEFWLLDSPNPNALSLHQSDIDHYVSSYERSKYEYMS